MKKQELSRRAFLKGSAAFAVTGMFAGCASGINCTAIAESENTADAKPSLKDRVSSVLETDYVVVGSGCCGLTSAVQAAELGMKVILLEKNGFLGGTTLTAEMCFGLFTDIQQQLGLTEKLGSFGNILKETMNYHHYRSDRAITERFYRESKDNIKWLQEQGVEFIAVMPLGNSYPTAHVYNGLGHHLVEKLGAKANELGVTIYTNAPGRELIVENGAVTGIYAEIEGEIVQINAKAVLLATGGYSANEEMLKKYAHASMETKDAGIPGRDGDGINMGLAAGGAEWTSMGAVMYFGAILKDDVFGTHLNTATLEGGFRFNEKGERFFDESINQINFSHCGNATNQQKASWGLYSKATLDHFTTNGTAFGAGAYVAPGAPLTDLWAQIEANMALENPQIFRCETLEDVAKTAGVNYDTLKAQVERYDQLCKNGFDEDFLKDPALLIPVGEGPYYLFKHSLGLFATSDGLHVNLDNQVLDANGEVITGLFAGGADAGGLQGDTYDVGICPGSQQGWGIQSGRVAAKYVAENLI